MRVEQAANEESRPDQENERRGDLEHHEGVPEAERSVAARQRARLILELCHHGGLRRLQRGSQTEQDAGA